MCPVICLFLSGKFNSIKNASHQYRLQISIVSYEFLNCTITKSNMICPLVWSFFLMISLHMHGFVISVRNERLNKKSGCSISACSLLLCGYVSLEKSITYISCDFAIKSPHSISNSFALHCGYSICVYPA